MEKKEFIKFLDDMFKSFGFKKKGNSWLWENEEIKKIINLQRSNFNNSYYLNFGFILKSVELENLETHIGRRLSSPNEEDNKKIFGLLNFEIAMRDEERKSQLSFYIKKC